MSVKRLDLFKDDTGAYMDECDDGDYVYLEDYESLQRERDALREALSGLHNAVNYKYKKPELLKAMRKSSEALSKGATQ